MRRPEWWATGLVLVFALLLSDSLLRIPIQRYDSIELILDARRSPSATATFTSSLSSHGYLRPMFRAQNKLLMDLGQQSSLHLAYRGFHAALVTAFLLLFAQAAQVRTREDFGAFAVATGILVGVHTFRGAVGEAYPVNHYLNVAVVCFATLALARSRGGLAVDLLGLVGFVYAILILETGALVWVIAVAAWAVGWRGLSRRAIAVMTGLLLAYLYLRFAYLPTGLPGLSERSSGFLFSILDPPELMRRFGERPVAFYAYNVVTSILSVLFSEPRAGRFVAVNAWLNHALSPGIVINLATSLVTTGAIAVAGVRAWRRRTLDDDGRLILVFLAVLVANAAISYPYTKDEIMIPGGAFYALAAYAAIRGLLASTGPAPRTVLAMATASVLFAASIGWTVRAAGVPYHLRAQAFKQRGDWAELPGDWRRTHQWPSNPVEQEIVGQLRDEALTASMPNPRFEPRWLQYLLEE